MNFGIIVKPFLHLLPLVAAGIFDNGLCMPSFVKIPELQNKICSSVAIVDFGVSRSVILCSERCYNNINCQSFFYKQTGICFGCKSVISESAGCSVENGTKYYATNVSVTTTESITYGNRCISETDCPQAGTECRNSGCECKGGYSLNPSTKTCTDGCTAYGSTYIEYANMDLDVPNSAEFSDITQEDCRVRCEQNGCRGYNYSGHYKKCKLRQETPLTMPSAWKPFSQVNYYNRNCA